MQHTKTMPQEDRLLLHVEELSLLYHKLLLRSLRGSCLRPSKTSCGGGKAERAACEHIFACLRKRCWSVSPTNLQTTRPSFFFASSSRAEKKCCIRHRAERLFVPIIAPIFILGSTSSVQGTPRGILLLWRSSPEGQICLPSRQSLEIE